MKSVRKVQQMRIIPFHGIHLTQRFYMLCYIPIDYLLFVLFSPILYLSKLTRLKHTNSLLHHIVYDRTRFPISHIIVSKQTI